MKYDDASWHSGGDFPEDAPEEYGGTHIALFLRWCFTKGWAGVIHVTQEPVDTQRVIDGTLPATDFLFTYCDGKLTNEDLSAAGNAFASKYYGADGLYLEDYAAHFGDSLYSAPEQDHDFATFAAVLEKRFQSGVLTKHETSRRPWWKFWEFPAVWPVDAASGDWPRRASAKASANSSFRPVRRMACFAAGDDVTESGVSGR